MSSSEQGHRDTVDCGFGCTAAVGDHIGHFYRGAEQRFSVLGPYVVEGIRREDKCVVISSPEVATELCKWLAAKGIDADRAQKAGQLLLHPGEATGRDMHALVDDIDRASRNSGHKFVRWAGDAGWALARNTSVREMLRWEADYDKSSVGWKILALCQFDLTQFGGDVVMDAMHSHPLCIMGDVLVPNPFHVSPDRLLQELSELA